MKLEIIERQIKELEEAKVEMLQEYNKDNNWKKLTVQAYEFDKESDRLTESKRLEEKRLELKADAYFVRLHNDMGY